MSNLLQTMKRCVSNKGLFIYLIAYFLYIDGVGAVISLATNYGANRFKLFTRVVLPGSLPSVLTGVLLALNLTLLLTVAIEIITAKEGLGSIIWFSWQTMRTETMYVSLTVLMILGVLFNGCMHWLTRLLTPWHQRTE